MKDDNTEIDISKGQILFYQSDDGHIKLNVRLEDETVWMTQAALAELFQVKPQNITMHLKNIYAEEELNEEATCKDFLQVQNEGGREVRRKVLDIYSTSIDYDPKAVVSVDFFKQVQNKMHWAAHGHTAAELIFERADAENADMGVTNFPGKRLLKKDVEVAKNYLGDDELNILNRIVTTYLETAELQALNRKPMTMNDWVKQLDMFLNMTGQDLLTHAGTVSHQQTIAKAHEEYEKFRSKMLEEPTEVEKHFIEAENKFKKIKGERE